MTADRIDLRAFLSYSKGSDSSIVQKLRSVCRSLEDAGIAPWVDWESLSVGDMLLPEVGDAVAGSDFFVLFLNDAASTSEWVRQEFNLATYYSRKKGPGFMVICQIEPGAALPVSSGNRKPWMLIDMTTEARFRIGVVEMIRHMKAQG